MRQIAAFLAGLFCAATLLSQQTAVLVFGNGLSRTQEQAWRSHGLLEQKYAEHLGIFVDELRQTFEPQIAYNTTRCESGRQTLCLPDWFESIVQAIPQNAPSVIAKAWSFMVGLPGILTPEEQAHIEQIAENLLDDTDQLSITEADLQRQVDLYHDSVAAKKKVVILAHSQGNFFANAAWENLSESDRRGVGIVSVATPAHAVASGGPHRTSHTDFIRHVPGALEPNTYSGPDCTPGWGCHAWSAYLGGGESELEIMEDIDEVLASLVIVSPLPPPVIPDTLLAIDASRGLLVRIDDPNEAVLTTIGSLGVEGLRSLTFDRHRRVLWALGGSPGTLYTIDMTTGHASVHVPLALEDSLGFQVRSIAMGPDGLLYGLTNTTFSNSKLVVINTMTGAVIGLTGELGRQFDGFAYDHESQRFFLAFRFGFGALYSYTLEDGLSFIRGILLNGLTWLADIPGSTNLYGIQDPSFFFSSRLVIMNEAGAFISDRITEPRVRLSGVEMVKFPE